MADDIRKKQLSEKIEKRLSNLRSELEVSFGHVLSDDMLRHYVYEEISRRIKGTIEAALKDFESGEELLFLKEQVQQRERQTIVESTEECPLEAVVPIPAPVVETKIEKAQIVEAKKDFRKYVRGKK